MAGDEILMNHSHQQTMTSVLTEMTSLVGLSVKVLDPRDGFPGGKQFHHEKGYMLDWMDKVSVKVSFARYSLLASRVLSAPRLSLFSWSITQSTSNFALTCSSTSLPPLNSISRNPPPR